MSEHRRSADSGRRPYRLKARAASQDETRRRITEATVELHEEQGPLATTVSAIAERAGVQRLTVYRHFPDEEALFAACTGHYIGQHPFPDPRSWAEVADPVVRLRRGLGELYAYWGSVEAMFAKILRDQEVDPERTRGAPLVEYMEGARDALVAGWGIRGRRAQRLRGVVGHAVDFRTWHSLVRRHGLGHDEVVGLMVALAEAAAELTATPPRGRSPRSGEGGGGAR